MVAYYWKIIKKLVVDYSNPILRKARGKNTSIIVWKFGELNPDKIIYFITDMSSEGSGIFSMYIGILEHLLAAKNMGWVPVIDDTPALFRRNKHKFRKKENVMNEMFAFNNEVSVQEALNSKNVIISSMTDLRCLREVKSDKKIVKNKTFFDYSEDDLRHWRIFADENLPYKQEVQEELINALNQVVGKKKNILGVAIREGKMGMNASGLNASGEYKQPTIEKIIDVVEEYLNTWECDYVYLSCETEKAIDMFRKKMGNEIVLSLPRLRMDFDYVMNIRSMKDGLRKDSRNVLLQENYKKYDLDYVKDMYILSKCDFFITPINCGTEVAFLKNDNLKDYFVIKE